MTGLSIEKTGPSTKKKPIDADDRSRTATTWSSRQLPSTPLSRTISRHAWHLPTSGAWCNVNEEKVSRFHSRWSFTRASYTLDQLRILVEVSWRQFIKPRHIEESTTRRWRLALSLVINCLSHTHQVSKKITEETTDVGENLFTAWGMTLTPILCFSDRSTWWLLMARFLREEIYWKYAFWFCWFSTATMTLVL